MDDYDVIVLGTGGAALTAAAVAAEEGARVGLFEKGETVGGTTVYSGGMIWIPLNQHQPPEKGDTRDKAVTYLKALSNGTISDEMVETYVDRGPEMVSYLHDRTPVQFYAVADFPDYHPEQDGGLPQGGRSLETPLFPYGELGAWKDRVHIPPYYQTYHLTIGQTTLGQPVPQEITPEEMQRRIDNDERGMGLALGGRLLKACLDRGVQPQTGHRGVDLIMEDGRVAGVVFETASGRKEVHAPNVVIATGGFEHNEDLKRAFLRGPASHTVGVETNTGDGLKMAMRAGAMIANMPEAWWMPMIEVPTSLVATGQQILTYERTLPGAIMVNKTGKRFTNEAANYNAFGAAFHEQDVSLGVYKNLPCWLVFDQNWLDKYGFAGGLGATEQASTDWMTSADTLRGLAEKLGIPGDALENTVERFNTNARNLEDLDFNRGQSAQDQWWGDPTLRDGTARASLGPLETGPYYAIQVFSGMLGTKGGPKTDTRARVVDLDGNVIEGLYAAGNAMASPMGMTYGGAGGTLGPAMVFGYLAGRDIGERVGSRSLQTVAAH
ncbi:MULTISPECIES: FAD-binding protein [unclassified Frankia]|uniref:FAD-binding protein n=1 Tax=unclassified Frankia TaxID=2632575 RepID=UPI002AD2DD69|nr:MULTISPECIES: FAD-binding protein [unclassified Frankia]